MQHHVEGRDQVREVRRVRLLHGNGNEDQSRNYREAERHLYPVEEEVSAQGEGGQQREQQAIDHPGVAHTHQPSLPTQSQVRMKREHCKQQTAKRR